MPLQLFNTLTRAVEPLVPVTPGRVTMYTCGPTIYNYAHIGNFRTFLFEDLLRRWLEASGYEVFHIMNLTDVDDKTIRGALTAGTSLRSYVDPYATAFFEDCDWLRLKPAHVYPRATEYIGPMIALIESLLSKGVAYRGDDGSVYFSIAKFPAYGRLSQLDRRELREGASGRVSADEYEKENAQDFALWKAAKPEDEKVGAAWDASFGRGRPGWHIECSAMALELIAQRFGTQVLDIHAGGVDLIFPHHEDEIAQSCAHTGQELFARIWVHGEFLNIRGSKMSKRFGNVTTPRDMRADGIDPGAIRLLICQTHYRQRLDLTDEGLAAAREASQRLGDFSSRLHKAEPTGPASEWGNALRSAISAAMDDDLNAPRALAAVFDAVRSGNRMLDAGEQPSPEALAAWTWAMELLDVLPGIDGAITIPGTAAITVPDPKVLGQGDVGELGSREWATTLAGNRAAAKARRDYKEADRIRDELKASGWEIRDNKDGSIEVRRLG